MREIEIESFIKPTLPHIKKNQKIIGLDPTYA